MIILGVDPGTATIGYGFIKKSGSKLELLDYGTINTSPKDTTSKRLDILFNELSALIEKYKPVEAAVEELFFAANAKTAISVGQARGVILLAIEKSGVTPAEYTPLQIKQALVGFGRAEKKQVQTMVKSILKMDHHPSQDDAADALAVAICHAHSVKMNSLKQNK